MSQPETKPLAHQIVEEINSLIAAKRVNSFLLRGVEAKAQRLQARFPGDYEVVLGIVDSLRGEFRDMRAHFLAAATHGSEFFDIPSAYSVSLSNGEYFVEALEVLRPFAQAHPDDIDIQIDLFKKAMSAGYFFEAYQTYQHLGILKARFHTDFAEMGEALGALVSLLKEREIGDEETGRVADAVGAFLRNECLHSSSFSVAFTSGLGELAAYGNYYVFVDESSERVAEAEAKLDSFLAEYMIGTGIASTVAFSVVAMEDRASYSGDIEDVEMRAQLGGMENGGNSR